METRNKYYIAFSPDFDTQTQNRFIENFKSNTYFSSFKYIESDKEFSTPGIENYVLNDFGEIEEDELFNPDEENNLDNLGNDNDNISNNNDDNVENNTTDPKENNKNDKLTKRQNESASQEFKIFTYHNEDDLFEDIKQNSFKLNGDFLFSEVYAIIFNSVNDYTLYFNPYYHKELIKNLINERKLFEDYKEYLKVNNLQIITSNAVMKTLNSNINSDIEFTFKIMDRIEYSKQNEVNGIVSNIPILMLFYFVPCICTLLNHLISEKESKIKESLIMVGLNKSVSWISWTIIYSIYIVIASIVAVIIMSAFKMISYIHWTIILTILIIFGLSCCSISFTLSTLINKTKRTITTWILFFLIFLALYVFAQILHEGTTAECIFGIVFPPVAYSLIFKQFVNLERLKRSVSFGDMFENSILRKYFIILVVSFILYFLLAIYLDNILPQGSNIHKKWHFFITDLFRHSKKTNRSNYKTTSSDNIDDDNNNSFIEKEPEGLKKSVEVNHISRKFKVKKEEIEILKDISFNAYDNEIFAILGHNGAGKSTLFRIMTGELSSTDGEVYYDDVPIHDNKAKICKQFGYCPQFDTFNRHLTVGEHIQLFAGIKGIKIDVDKTLEEINLLDKKNHFSRYLSRGQKRKLSIALALLGSPNYVFLDEPTTGLDPYSRKFIWKLLSQKKKGCTIFVTTQYMDEADLLADRKMIISNSRINCLGTSLFLKNRFSMNYILNVNMVKEGDSALVDSVVDRYCLNASQNKVITSSHYNTSNNDENSNNNENNNYTNNNNNNNNNNKENVYIVSYSLPMNSSHLFKDIINDINGLIKDQTNSINNFSVTSPTLEEIFVKLENNNDEGRVEDDEIKRNIQQVKKFTALDMNNVDEDDALVKKLDPVFGKTKLYQSSSLKQICSIIKIRLKMFLRNKTYVLAYILLPVCLIGAYMFFESSYIDSLYYANTTYAPLKISPTLYDNVKWFKNTAASNGTALNIINSMNNNNNNNMANSISFENVDYDQQLTIASNKLTKESNYIGGLAGTDEGNQTLQFTIYNELKYNFAIPIGINLIHNAILEQNHVDKKISVSYNIISRYEDTFDEDDEEKIINTYPEQRRQTMEVELAMFISIAMSFLISIFGPMTVKEREEGITWQLYLNGTRRINYWIGIFLGDAIFLFIPFALLGIIGIFSGISICQPKELIYTLVITLLWIIGCLCHQYAMAQFFKRYSKCLRVFKMVNLILSIFISFFFLGESLLSHLLVKPKNGDSDDSSTLENSHYTLFQNAMYIFIIIFVPSAILFYFIKFIDVIYHKKLTIGKKDIQTFTLSKEYQAIVSDKTINKFEKNKIIAKSFFNWKLPSFSEVLKSKEILIIFGFAIALILLYALILFIKEKGRTKSLKCHKKYTSKEIEEKDVNLKNGPKDVYNEFQRVEQSLNEKFNQEGIALKVYRLSKDKTTSTVITKKSSHNIRREEENQKQKKQLKNENQKDSKKNDEVEIKIEDENEDENERIYNEFTEDHSKNKHIRPVNDVTLGVDVGQCLGLLGPNGAGKTTVLSMIAGFLSRSHGDIIYGDKNLNDVNLSELSVGYLPQNNPLWELLTVKETIQFYLNICGYPSKNISQYTKTLIEACGIENQTNKKVCETNEGDKRKLSLIIAICSSPSYLILDEPTAGMDPFTRRYMWKFISELKNVRETATILTTHSTEEAEALCDRIAILMNGELVRIDTPKSIKMNQSKPRYVLEVFTDQPKEFEREYVKKENQNLFGLNDTESYDLSTSLTYQKYSVEMKPENISKVFSLMEKAKESGLVSQYNFGQSSLEQVFIESCK